ncbi:Orn/Lys/Arg decarboxylase N-terminal domain-containing protein, partial [Cronobacter sakazakii]|nr:Orn/Lys/Arg decarboxylase N-terminal domain-containing protein [Cronobacter sakazakii]
MQALKIGVSRLCPDCFSTDRTTINIHESDYIDIAAAVMTVSDIYLGLIDEIEMTGFGIPVFVVCQPEERVPAEYLPRVAGVFEDSETYREHYGRQLEAAAQKYETALRPPFFRALVDYVSQGNSAFDCPGHQGGDFFRRHPAGNQFVSFLGDTLFRADLCNADVAMGDLLIHEGAPCLAQQHAAAVFNADKTYFVLNGTSSANKVVLNALLAPGDLVLFDRNNHKSNHHGALLQAGATPVYLETARNPYGFIGGIDAHCFDERYLRERVREVAPARAAEKRPFRLAVIQLGT